MKLKLYGAMLSPFVRKVRIMLALKKVGYDTQIERFSERQKQVELAKQRGEAHIGSFQNMEES